MIRLVAFCLLLTACTGGPGLLRGSGEDAPAPAGYQKLCAEHPDFEACTK